MSLVVSGNNNNSSGVDNFLRSTIIKTGIAAAITALATCTLLLSSDNDGVQARAKFLGKVYVVLETAFIVAVISYIVFKIVPLALSLLLKK